MVDTNRSVCQKESTPPASHSAIQRQKALADENGNIAGGSILEGDVEYLVRTLNEFQGVNELASLFPVSLQAVSKHIKVLEAAGVVSRRREGQTRPVHLEPASLDRTAEWLEAHRRRLEARYERLDELLARRKEAT